MLLLRVDAVSSDSTSFGVTLVLVNSIIFILTIVMLGFDLVVRVRVRG